MELPQCVGWKQNMKTWHTIRSSKKPHPASNIQRSLSSWGLGRLYNQDWTMHDTVTMFSCLFSVIWNDVKTDMPKRQDNTNTTSVIMFCVPCIFACTAIWLPTNALSSIYTINFELLKQFKMILKKLTFHSFIPDTFRCLCLHHLQGVPDLFTPKDSVKIDTETCRGWIIKMLTYFLSF
jgi:hypothetical protein